MTVAEFQAGFPAFEDVSSPLIQRQLDIAVPLFDISDWGIYLAYGLGNFVAHNVAMDPSLGGALKNPTSTDVLEKRVGSVAVTRSGAMLEAEAKNPFLRTLYGQAYLYWRRVAGIGLGAVAV